MKILFFILLQLAQEQKYDLEQTLKKCKTNEKVLSSEIEHLRQRLDKFESNSIPDKEKEIHALNLKIKQVSKIEYF
jgi:hypothetical protein